MAIMSEEEVCELLQCAPKHLAKFNLKKGYDVHEVWDFVGKHNLPVKGREVFVIGNGEDRDYIRYFRSVEEALYFASNKTTAIVIPEPSRQLWLQLRERITIVVLGEEPDKERLAHYYVNTVNDAMEKLCRKMMTQSSTSRQKK